MSIFESRKKTKNTLKKFVLITIFFICSLNLFLLENVSAQDDKEVTGFAASYTCSQIKTDLENAEDPRKTVLENVYKAQCEGKTDVETYYKSPTEVSTKSSNENCKVLQQNIIDAILAKETPPQEKIDLYSNECFASSETQTESSSTAGGYIPIRLSAPLPIGDDGKQIENSNKSYLFTYMVKLYRFVLGIAGIAAVIELILAGFQIALAADDTSGVENGKKRVVQTLEGIGILFCSAIILNTINPVAYNFNEEVVISLVNPYLSPGAYVNSSEFQTSMNNPNTYANVKYSGKDVAATELPAGIKAILDTIATMEGTIITRGTKYNGYDVRWPSKTFDNGFVDHPKIRESASINGKQTPSDAAGRYGWLSTYWYPARKSYNKSNDPDVSDFSPATQDRVTAYFIKMEGKGIYDLLLNGNIEEALKVPYTNNPNVSWLGHNWASFPNSPHGQTTKKQSTLHNDVVNTFKQRFNYYKSGGSVSTNSTGGNNNSNTTSNANTGSLNNKGALVKSCEDRNSNPNKRSQVDALIKSNGNFKIKCSDNGKNDSIIFGDSIALGIAGQYNASVALAQGGLQLYGALENDGLLSFLDSNRKFKKVIISIGTNGNTAPAKQLEQLRSSLLASGGTVVWIQPGEAVGTARSNIKSFSNTKNDKLIDIHPYMNYKADPYHPTINGGYKAIADKIDK